MIKLFNRRKHIVSEDEVLNDVETTDNYVDGGDEIKDNEYKTEDVETGMSDSEAQNTEDSVSDSGTENTEDSVSDSEAQNTEDSVSISEPDDVSPELSVSELDPAESGQLSNEADYIASEIQDAELEKMGKEQETAEELERTTDTEPLGGEEIDNMEESDNNVSEHGEDEIDSDEEELEEDSSLSSDRDMSYEENRRAYRRKRRIRNQIIAYGVVVIFMAVIITAGVMAGRKVSGIIKEKGQNEEQLAQQTDEQDVEADNQQEEIVIEEPPEIEEVSLDEQLEEIVNNCISVMPLEDKVAGLFIISPEALTGFRTVSQAGDATQEALGKYAVGGLIYFSHNIEDKEQLSQMLSNTVAMSKYPMFLGVDEEGGSVSRVANSAIEVAQVGDMLTIGESGDTTAAYEAGITIGSYLKDLGFNLDFAPVADVVADASSSPLKERSFGAEPSLCADMVSNVVEGIQGTSVSACLKHFPGIGDSKEDTHERKVETTKTLDEMRKSDFIPFQAGIESGVDLILVSHITASSVDTEGTPSSLSRIMITDVLRTELGFEGVVITDALDMRAISDYYTSEEAAVNAILAGADMLLMPEDFEAAYDGVLAAVQDGRISEERIDESLRRIYRIKYADKLE